MFQRPTKMVSCILILIIIIITTFSLINLSKHRKNIISLTPEGMTNEKHPSISNINISSNTFPLKEYVIKSSYNSAYSGTLVSTTQVKHILKRGCRFLDFELFFIDEKAQVAFSTDPYRRTIDSDNSILLSDVFDTLITDGFANAPNSGDPLFIQLRIKSKPNLDSGIFPLIVASIHSKLGNRMYQGTVDGNTQITDLMGKIILVIDQKVCPEFLKYNDLVSLTNMVSAGKTLHKYDYSTTIQLLATPFTSNPDGTTDVITTMKMTETPDPDLQNTIYGKLKKLGYIFYLLVFLISVIIILYIMNTYNLIGSIGIIGKINTVLFTFLEKFKNVIGFCFFILLFSLIFVFSYTYDENHPYNLLLTDYAVQIIPYKFYLHDGALKNYEELFSNAHTAFIPFSKII